MSDEIETSTLKNTHIKMSDSSQKNLIYQLCPKIIEAFGVEFRILCEEHLLLLMNWRNHPEVRPFMDDTRQVTMDVLQFWYGRICNSNNGIYYIVYRHNEPVGYIGLSQLDMTSHICGEDEIIINPECIGQGLSFKLMLCRELILDRLSIKTCIVRINTENVRSRSFFMKLGYEYTRTENGFDIYISQYKTRLNALREIAKKKGLDNEFILHFG